MKNLAFCVLITFFSITGCKSVPIQPVSFIDSGKQSKDYMLLTLKQVKKSSLPYNISSYSTGGSSIFYRYRIAFDVFLRIETESNKKYLYLYDTEGEWIRENYPQNEFYNKVKKVYNIEDNDNYDKEKKYRIYCICEFHNRSGFVDSFNEIETIDCIEGLAP
jgi:uncharacterized protein YcfL